MTRPLQFSLLYSRNWRPSFGSWKCQSAAVLIFVPLLSSIINWIPSRWGSSSTKCDHYAVCKSHTCKKKGCGNGNTINIISHGTSLGMWPINNLIPWYDRPRQPSASTQESAESKENLIWSVPQVGPHYYVQAGCGLWGQPLTSRWLMGWQLEQSQGTASPRRGPRVEQNWRPVF